MKESETLDLSSEMEYSNKIHHSYALGGFLDNFITAAFAIRVFGFYEDEVLLPIILVSTAVILYGIWNMFNDTIAGYLSDKRTRFTKRWGRRFPWFAIAVIPYSIVYLLIFTVPPGGDIVTFIWLLVMICLFDFFYSFWFTNWVSIFPDKFRSEKERTKIGGLSTLWGQLGIALGMLIPPIIIIYGNRETYIISAVILMIIGIISAIFIFPGMRENEELREKAMQIDPDVNDESFFQTLKFSLKQKNFVVYVYTYFAQMVLFSLVLSSLYYWVRYILVLEADAEMYISAAFLIGSLISVPIWVKLGRKYGNRKIYMYGALLISLSCVPLFFISDLTFSLVGTAFMGFALGSIWTLMYPTFSDVIDEIVVKTGNRKEGIYTGIRTFFGRSSNIIVALTIAIVHVATFYVPGAEFQEPLAQWGIRIIMALVPMTFYFVSFLLMWKVYDLTPEKVGKIRGELKEMGL